jgi:hypothetical protein
LTASTTPLLHVYSVGVAGGRVDLTPDPPVSAGWRYEPTDEASGCEERSAEFKSRV